MRAATPKFEDLRVLVVEDDDILLELIRDRLCRDGAEVLVAESTLTALLQLGPGHIDVVVAEVRPPGGSSVELIREVMSRNPRAGVLLLASPGDKGPLREGLAAGAIDFATKPFRYEQLGHLIEQFLHWRELREPSELRQVQVRRLVEETEAARRAGPAIVEEIPAGRDRAHIESVLILAKVAEFNDQETANHLLRVSRYAALTAAQMGMAAWDVEDIALAAPLHDIGKVAIDHRVLRRRGPLSPEERVEMKLHTIRGSEILGGVESFATAFQIARHHHERFDGRGYPDGLAGEEIPLAARITAVVDVFDALTTRRSYKQEWPLEDAMDYLWRQGARQFDLEVVSAFSSAEDRVREVYAELKDAPRGSLLDYAPRNSNEAKRGRSWGDSIQVS